MLFNSFDFALFLPVVFLVYWFVIQQNLKWQNIFLVLASYIFYGWWDWRFLILVFVSTVADYLVGLQLMATQKKRHRNFLLWVSIIINLGFLIFFKYFNFFLESFIATFSVFGLKFEVTSLKVILPVGISFYTFQTLSYTIDVYRRKLPATKNFIAFSAFVSFFPQLVAGPIEKAKNLLPQFYKPRIFEYTKAIEGLRQILWGLFKKIVVADNCAELANYIFNTPTDYSGSTLFLGAFFFALQIYCDFSGYSDIAIGVAKLFGFHLMQNFAFPYFSRDIAEFWRRWHISLSNWFKDYVYIPLGGSRVSKLLSIRNTFIIFLVSGLWHGANWTFIVWGLLNAIYFLPLLLRQKNRKNLDIVAKDRFLPSIKEIGSIVFTFTLTIISWIFFRADSIGEAINYINRIFSPSFFSTPNFHNTILAKNTLIFILFMFSIEWWGRKEQFAISNLNKNLPIRSIRYLLYYGLILLIIFFGGQEQTFIYFQF